MFNTVVNSLNFKKGGRRNSGHCKLQAQFIMSKVFGVVLKNESEISGRRHKSLLYRAKTPANTDSGIETAALGSRPIEGMQF